MCPAALFGKTPTYQAPNTAPAKSSQATQTDAEARRLQSQASIDQIAGSGLGDITRPKGVGISLGGSY